MSSARKRAAAWAGRILLLALLAAALLPAGAAQAKDCKPFEFQCLYNEVVKKYERLRDIVVPELERQVSLLEAEVLQLEGQLTGPLEAATKLGTMIERTDLGFLGLDAGTMERYTEALEFISGQNQALLTEYEAFASETDCDLSPLCSSFRSGLSGLLYQAADITTLSNEVLALQMELDGQVPLQPLQLNAAGAADFIAKAPPSLLFPFYYALNAAPASPAASTPPPLRAAGYASAGVAGCPEAYCGFFDSVAAMLTTIEVALLDLKTALEAVRADVVKVTNREPLCTLLFLDPGVPDLLSRIASIANVTSTVLAEFGSWLEKPKLDVIGEEAWNGASFGGEVKLSFERRPAAALGVSLTMLTNPVRLIGEWVDTRVSDCRQRYEQYLLICALESDVKKNDAFFSCKKEVLFSNDPFGF